MRTRWEMHFVGGSGGSTSCECLTPGSTSLSLIQGTGWLPAFFSTTIATLYLIAKEPHVPQDHSEKASG